ncbi:MAG: hypothetical protein V7607_4438 [Solirubrobacteraceae bacterium]
MLLSLGTQANPRYDTPIAPGGLGLVHRLLNTAPAGRPQAADLLESVASAQEWLDAAVAEWGQAAPALEVTAEDLRGLRALRDAVRAALLARGDGAAEGAARLHATADVWLSGDGSIGAAPRGRTAAQWLRSAVLVECFVAEVSGTWPRLKICANPRCPVAFYDRSRNRSGVWHDVHVCGNAINLRASRARRRGRRGAAATPAD